MLIFVFFYPRDAMRKRGLCCRPSDTLVHCIHTAEDIVKLLILPGSHHSSFLHLSASTQFQEEPLQWG